MGSLLALLFIGAVAAVGIVVGTRPTVADGHVIAETIVKSSKQHRLTVECDDRIPIGVDGARFRCNIAADDGSTARIRYTMDRAGAYSAAVVDSTAPTRTGTHRAAEDDEEGEDGARDRDRGHDRGDRGDPWK